MTLRLSQYTAPTAEPLHLTEAKLHLRLAVDAAAAVLYTSEDEVLSAEIASARQVAEIETWRALVLQVWDMFLDAWPEGDEIKLYFPPLLSVESVTYTTSDGTGNTLETTEYDVDTDSTPGRIVLGHEKLWPTDTLTPKNPIRIRYRCGHVIPFTANADTDVMTAVNLTYLDGDKVRLSVSGGELPVGLSVKTDYYFRDISGDTFKLALSSGGDAIDITSAGSGILFVGEVPPAIITGMKLVLTDLHENRGNTVFGRAPSQLPRAASHYFAMDSAKEF